MLHSRDDSFFLHNYYPGICMLIFLFQFLIVFFLTYNKNGFVCDELLSFSDTASIYTDDPRFYQKNDLFNVPHTKSDWLDSLTVDETNSVFSQSFETIWSAIMGDDRQFNCNLYMFILNFVCSFFPGSFSKWIPIMFNFICYQASQLIMLQISKHLLADRAYRICLMLAFGFSAGILSCTLYIRFYMLVTFMVLCLLWLLFRLADEQRISVCILYMPVMLLICYLGYRVHQYFLVYGAIALVGFGLYLFLTKQLKKVCLYLLSLVGIFTLLMSSPYKGWLIYMVTKGEGANQIGRLLELSWEGFGDNLAVYWGYFYRHIIGHRFNLIIYVIAMIFFFCTNVLNKAVRKNKKGLFLTIISGSVIVYILFLVKASSELEWRYLSIIYGPAIICMTTLLYISAVYCSQKCNKGIVFVAMFLFFLHILGNDLQKDIIDYVYFDVEEKRAIVATNYNDLDNVYICESHLWNILLDYDVMSEDSQTTFVRPSSIYVATPFSDTYDKKNCLLWFMERGENYSEEMRARMIQEIKEKTDYKTIEFIFSTKYSSVYMMEK